jgi:disulfide bond formation protein DsbB
MNDNSFVKGFAYTFATVFVLALFALMMLYGAWVGAFVSVHLWTWFVVPTFGLVPLKMPVAFGLALLVGLWTRQLIKGHKEDRPAKDQIAEVIGQLSTPWFVLLCGYVCHHFFM